MRLPRLKALSFSFLLAAVLTAPAWGADTALPGTLNYIEGQASVGDQTLTSKSIGSVELQPGQSLSTGNGKAEILLTPGVFLRVGDNSTVKMVSSNLTNTEADLVKGQATVEVAEIHPYNMLRIGENGATTQMMKNGFYAFDADHDQVRVLKGEANVQYDDQNVQVKGERVLDLSTSGRLKTTKFDKNVYETSDLYRFSYLRSQYLAEANVDVARNYYAGGPGWYGAGWYWNPWFAGYTWIPGDGILYSPFRLGILFALVRGLRTLLRLRLSPRIRILRTLLLRARPGCACATYEYGTCFCSLSTGSRQFRRCRSGVSRRRICRRWLSRRRPSLISTIRIAAPPKDRPAWRGALGPGKLPFLRRSELPSLRRM